MRIVALGKWHTYPSDFLHGTVEGSIRNGWRAMGVEIADVPYSFQRNIILDYKPNYIFCHCLFNAQHPEITEKRIYLLTDLKHRLGNDIKIYYHMADPNNEPRIPMDVSEFLDGALMGHLNWDNFKVWNIPLYYWPYGTWQQSKIHKPVELYKSELLFTGQLPCTGIYAQRSNFVRSFLDTGKLTIFPNKKVRNTIFTTSEVAGSAKAVLNLVATNDLKMYLSVRPFQYIGAGALNIQQNNEALKSVFRDKVHYLGFDGFDKDAVLDLYDYYVEKHPDKGWAIRRNGFEYCQRNHNYQVRMKDIIDVLEGRCKRVRYLLEDF